MPHRSSLGALLALAVLAPPASAAGTSCADPVHWELTPQQAVGITSARIDELRGHGVRIDATSDLFGLFVTVEARRAGWRVCAVGGDGWELPGTTGQGGERSFARRGFNPGSPVHRLYVTVARRSAADGASCANPFVVYHSYGDNGSEGDRRAGRVRVTDDAPQPEVITRTAQWQSAIGYRTCWAAALGSRSPGFVDRRHGDSLSRVLDRYACCPNHPSAFRMFYAAFARKE